MKQTIKNIMLVTVAAMATHAMAADKAVKKEGHKEGLLTKVNNEVSGQGYGDAGCGLGSIALGSKPGVMQIFASTTNGTSGTQTFGISSGTSNCGGLGGGISYIPVNQYIDANKVALQSDISRGSGETIEGLASIMGCQNSSELGSVLKAHYSEIFSNGASSKESASQIRDAAQKSQALVKTCNTLG